MVAETSQFPPTERFVAPHLRPKRYYVYFLIKDDAVFYAKKYEDRLITREEAVARMDELLAYERLA